MLHWHRWITGDAGYPSGEIHELPDAFFRPVLHGARDRHDRRIPAVDSLVVADPRVHDGLPGDPLVDQHRLLASDERWKRGLDGVPRRFPVLQGACPVVVTIRVNPSPGVERDHRARWRRERVRRPRVAFGGLVKPGHVAVRVVFKGGAPPEGTYQDPRAHVDDHE